MMWCTERAGLRILVVLIVFAVLGLLASCGEPDRMPGTDQAAAAEAQGRANAAGLAADEAGRIAADLAAAASAAEDRATSTRVQADIDAAVEARVLASAAMVKYRALRDMESGLTEAATRKAALAKIERDHEQQAQDFRSWVRLCRVVGLIGVIGGGIIGGAVAYLGQAPRVGAVVGLGIAGLGLVVITLGPATPWLPWALVPASAIGIGAWIWTHHREKQKTRAARAVVIAGSRAIDAVEREVPGGATEAKLAFGRALTDIGLGHEVETHRGPDRNWPTSQRGKYDHA